VEWVTNPFQRECQIIKGNYPVTNYPVWPKATTPSQVKGNFSFSINDYFPALAQWNSPSLREGVAAKLTG
jgi:hypothetical protein